MFIRIIKRFFITFGCITFVSLLLCFTTAPFRAWYYLSVSQGPVKHVPDYIVVMGAGGMPGEGALMRTWYGAKVAQVYPGAKVIVSLPGLISDSMSSVNLMKKELITRGVKPGRILLEHQGINTRDEALCIYKMLKEPKKQKICIVSSPEHMVRCVGSFTKAGFPCVDGVPAFESTLENSVAFQGKDLGGRAWIPSVGGNISLRYSFWTQMKYEVIVMREVVAITYYKLKGWI